ncbi:hypothetical protein ABS71_22905 [bacterium SCN 62-11]|nr:MAG: hypothetical protein ABS71_22905 [bacterium SCN 62-11]
MDLERFLEELSAEGAADSSGAFTLDPALARRKLKDYQQPFPYAFVGSLLAAAHLAGAPAVSLKLGAGSLSMCWPEPELSREQLGDLFGPLLVAPLQKYRRELALGINGALSMHPRRVEVSSGRWRQQLAPLEMLREGTPTPGLRVEVEYSWSSWPGRKFMRRLPELDVLQERCQLSVPSLQINGKVQPIPVPDGHCLAAAILEGGPPLFNAPLRDSLPPSDLLYPMPGKGPHGGIFCLYLDEPKDFRMVVDGISFPHEVSMPGAWGYLVAPQLRRDLSALSLVQDRELERMDEVVEAAFRFLLGSFCKDYEKLSPEKRLQAAPVLIYQLNKELQRSHWPEARETSRKLLHTFQSQSGGDSWEHFEAAYALYLLEIRQGGNSRETQAQVESTAAVRLKVHLRSSSSGVLLPQRSGTPNFARLLGIMQDLSELVLGSTNTITRQLESIPVPR